MALQALVFDFDGLILDTELPEYLTVRAEFEAHGLELPLEEWLGIIGRADHRHWLDWLEDELGAPLADRDAVLERRRAAHHALIRTREILPGVRELLTAARTEGLATAVASSSPRAWVEGHLDRLGLLASFDAVRTRDDVARAKPWPDLFLAATDAVGADPATAVALEDSHHGCAAAKAAGLFCVVAPNELTAAQDFAHADLVVDSLADLDLPTLAGHLAG